MPIITLIYTAVYAPKRRTGWPFLCLLALLLSSCQDNFEYVPDPPDTTPRPETLAEYIRTDPNLSLFNRALERTGLNETIAQPGPYTVFVVHNSAFQRYLTRRRYSSVDQIPLNVLQGLVAHHVLPQRLSAVEVYNIQESLAKVPYPTLSPDKPLIVEVRKFTPWSLHVGPTGIVVVTTDVEMQNGVMHTLRDLVEP
jgi:uncharacterized surface protein with fasciclin (FAS1) repeats